MLLASQIILILLIFITLWGFLPYRHWIFRAADFPRIQILILGIPACLWLLMHGTTTANRLLIGGALPCILWQLYMVLPYTPLWKKQVQNPQNDIADNRLSLILSNVLTPNPHHDALIALVREEQPDILLTVETDLVWEKALNELEKDYPYTVKIPKDNLYGMHLYSRLPLVNPQSAELLVADIPSIHTQVRLRNGAHIWLHCLHPMPPSPTEAEKSTTRDAELLLVGKMIRERGQPAIVFGDLNDVAWSKTTRTFRHISGLLDPRIGRYFINTYHVKIPFLRWALDHIFHSAGFTLVSYRRLRDIGSDHFPLYTELQYEPPHSEQRAEQQDIIPEADRTQLRDMHDTIASGHDEARRIEEQHTQNT